MRQAILLLALFSLSGAGSSSQSYNAPAITPTEEMPGGEGSISYRPLASFMQPTANLEAREVIQFHAGKAFAHQPWVKAPTITTGRDGLGPIYNARTCLACHINGGRGIMPVDGDQSLISAFLRLSIPGENKEIGVIPEPTYGDQLQSQSVALSHQLRHLNLKKNPKEVSAEAYTYVDWQTETFTYPDKSSVELRSPKIRLEQLGYGELHPDTLMSLRNAPPMHGMGLLEMIPQRAIDSLADSEDSDKNGISGRVNQVWNVETQKTEPGRFGLKANRPNIKIVTASAFTGDVGITNPLFPEQPCTKAQETCLKTPNGNDQPEDVELPSHLLDLVTNFTRNIGVPKRREPNAPETLKGREKFYQVGCHSCHQPSFTTGESQDLPHLSKQTIWPYSDLLLHDMGPALADGRPDYEASGSEWRTAPLWGVGLNQAVNGSNNLLHDGRARSVEEAILWHGGEAEATKGRFVQLPAKDRQVLIQFVESL